MKQMTDFGADNPYKTIGWHLKFARQQRKQSLAEVCGAVEIDNEMLAKIENGEQRPSEDILLLLISHFGLDDNEATSLWELAGYSNSDDASDKRLSVTVPHDLRVIYTDMIHVSVNDYGVIMNFMQSAPGNRSMAVSRVGMSKKHARSVLEILQKTLDKAETPKSPRLLKASKKRPQKTDG